MTHDVPERGGPDHEESHGRPVCQVVSVVDGFDLGPAATDGHEARDRCPPAAVDDHLPQRPAAPASRSGTEPVPVPAPSRLPVPAPSRSSVPAPSRSPVPARSRSRSHHRRSCGHGPAHATSGPPPFGSAEHRNAAGAADGSPRPLTVIACPSASTRSAGCGGSKTRAGDGPGTVPGHGAAGSVPERKPPPDRAGSGIAPRHPAHPLRGCASADGDRGDHRLRPEHPLHPCERTRRVVAGRGITAPEPELATGGGHHFVGHQTQQRDARGRGRASLRVATAPA